MAEQQAPKPEQPIWWRNAAWLILVLAFAWYMFSLGHSQHQQSLSYTAFKQRVQAGAVTSVTFEGDRVVGRLTQKGANKQAQQFVTVLPPVSDPALIPLLEKHDVDVRAQSSQESWWLRLMIGVLPWILIIGLFWYAGRGLQSRLAGMGGARDAFGFGRSKAKRFLKTTSKVTFDDVAGLEQAKRDLREITGYLKAPDQYRKVGAKIPKGILLMGSPGTGKTLLARAVAGEAEVPFFSTSGSEFIEVFVGVGASRVRDMFESAKKEAPAIIFIDEIDSVGRARGTGVGGGHDEREQTLNQILGEMDGFAAHEAVVVLAATNRPDVLDPALLRPGRFDRKIVLDLPDRAARTAVLKIHSRNVPLAEDVDLDKLAALTVGFSGADLENLVNEAALLSGREARTTVGMSALLSARDKVVLGGKRELQINEKEKRQIAYHEAGHAVAAIMLEHADPLEKVTIIPRGQALGATEQIPEEERHNMSASYIRDRIGVMLAGRVSEQLVYGEVSSGAEDDLKKATELARHMVTHWGMSERLGPVAFRRGEEHIFLGREMAQQREFSESTAQIIDEEIGVIVKRIEGVVMKLLQDHRRELDAVAEALLKQETLQSAQIKAVLEQAARSVA